MFIPIRHLRKINIKVGSLKKMGPDSRSYECVKYFKLHFFVRQIGSWNCENITYNLCYLVSSNPDLPPVPDQTIIEKC